MTVLDGIADSVSQFDVATRRGRVTRGNTGEAFEKFLEVMPDGGAPQSPVEGEQGSLTSTNAEEGNEQSREDNPCQHGLVNLLPALAPVEISPIPEQYPSVTNSSRTSFPAEAGEPALVQLTRKTLPIQVEDGSTLRPDIIARLVMPEAKHLPSTTTDDQTARTTRSSPGVAHTWSPIGGQDAVLGSESDAESQEYAPTVMFEEEISSPELATEDESSAPVRQLQSLLEGAIEEFQHGPTLSSIARTPGPGNAVASEVKVFKMRLKPDALGDVEVILRRSGSELRIVIQVEKQATADAINSDMSLLNENLGGLLAEDGSPFTVVTVVSTDLGQSVGSEAGSRAGGDSAERGQSAFHSGGEERPPPHKAWVQSLPAENETHDSDIRLRSGLDGILL